MIPLLHDFTGETVLVVGGGPVGARKARRFAAEARVVVLSPEFADRDFGGAQRVRAAPGTADIGAWIERTDPALVVAATDDGELNDAAATAAREAGALVNRADDHGGRAVDDVAVPATVRDGPVTLAIATGGRAPALSKYLREEFESQFGSAGEMATLVGDLRDDLQAREVDPQRRREIVRAVVRNRELWKALDRGEPNREQVLTDVIEELPGETA